MQIDFGEGEIDFGNDIDFGDMGSGEEVTLETGDIDWGADDEANAAEIDFDISIKDSGITIESSGMEGGVAKNNEALSVLDSPNHREQFLDELFEVKFEKIQRVFFILTTIKINKWIFSFINMF